MGQQMEKIVVWLGLAILVLFDVFRVEVEPHMGETEVYLLSELIRAANSEF